MLAVREHWPGEGAFCAFATFALCELHTIGSIACPNFALLIIFTCLN
jgi:hypothetical protein